MTREPLRIFIGYDSKEPVAYHVLANSIMRRASCPVAITPLVQSALRAQGLYTRERGPTESTEFSMTRFLVPALCGYKGHAVFMDCDMLCQADVAELWDIIEGSRAETASARHRWAMGDRPIPGQAPPAKAVLVCQHDYQPTATVKFLGQVNIPYPRKNWSSVMIFDCQQCEALTPVRVNILSGLELHRFSWLKDEQVGALPLEWNWLVGEYAPNPDAKVLHYTLGGPWFPDYRTCDHADAWFAEREAMLQPQIAQPLALAA